LQVGRSARPAFLFPRGEPGRARTPGPRHVRNATARARRRPARRLGGQGLPGRIRSAVEL